MADKYSKTLVKEWSDYEKVGIWDNCRWSVRLYSDRAIYKGRTVRWVNNSGTLAEVHERWTGPIVAKLAQIAEKEKADDADYTDWIYSIIRDAESAYLSD